MRKVFGWILLVGGLLMLLFCFIGMFTSGFLLGAAMFMFLGAIPTIGGLYLLKGKPTKKIAMIVIIGCLIIGSVCLALSPQDKTIEKIKTAQEPTKEKQPEGKKDISFQIVGKDSTVRNISFKIIIPERYSEKDLIDIMHTLKKERSWTEKLQASFYVKHFAENNAYYGLGYLPNGGEQTHKDVDGNYISVIKIGMSKEEFDNVYKASFDSIPNSTVIASMIDETGKSKNEIIQTPGKKYLYVHLFGNNKKWVEKLLPPNPETNQYFFDLPIEDQDYGFSIKIIPENHVAMTFGKNGNNVDSFVLID